MPLCKWHKLCDQGVCGTPVPIEVAGMPVLINALSHLLSCGSGASPWWQLCSQRLVIQVCSASEEAGQSEAL